MPTHEALADAFLDIPAAEWTRFSAAVVACQWSIRPALLDKTPRRDIRNRRQLRYHVMVTVTCDLFIESLSDVGDAFFNHGRCKCTCTYKQRKLDGKSDCAQSITSRMNVRARPKVLISVHCKPSLTRSRFLDAALIQAITPLVLIMGSRIWFTHQQNNCSHSNLFLRAVQTSNLRPNRGPSNNNTDKRGRNTACRTRKDVQNEKRSAELGRIVLQEVASADSICKKFHTDSVLNFCDWHVCHASVHDPCVSTLNACLSSFNVYLKKKISDLWLFYERLRRTRCVPMLIS